MFKYCTILYVALLPLAVGAQEGYMPCTDIPLLVGGQPLPNGFTGGLNAPQFSPIDWDGDGIKDLLVYDRGGKVAWTFLNRGTTGAVDYHFAPEYMDLLPQGSENFMLARDYNCDGIEDLFFFDRKPASGGGIFVWYGRRDVQGRLSFAPAYEELPYSSQFGLQPIYLYNPDLPNISDMDGDGDMDIAAFTLDFSFFRNVYYYENQSIELGYGCDSLIMVLRHQCWGLFAESGTNNTIVLSPGTDSCALNPYWHFRDDEDERYRHTGSTLTAIDYNGDGALDMVMGDAGFNTLNMMTGELRGDTVLIVQQDAVFPAYDQSIQLFSMPAGYFLDANNDGLTDMIAAVNEIGYGQARVDSVAWWYINEQSNANMVFGLQNKNFLADGMFDIGHHSAPAFVDHNGDGLPDLVVGCMSRISASGAISAARLTLLLNVGSATQPAFEVSDTDYAGLGALGLYGLTPTFGDLDGDGDADMVLGNTAGTLIFVENTAGAGNPAAWAAPQIGYSGINIGFNSTPQLFDLNEDGDLDLIVGEGNGNGNYFENRGTATLPSFDDQPTSQTVGWFDVNLLGGSGYSAPHFFRNPDGDIELYIGHTRGQVVHLNNIAGNVQGTYDTLNLHAFYNGMFSKIATADLDGDDTLEVVLGTITGGLIFYKWTVQDSIVAQQILAPEPEATWSVYPNPVRDRLHISPPAQGVLDFELYDALGRRWAQGNIEQAPYSIDLQGLPGGWYWAVLRQSGLGQTLRLFKTE